MDTQLEAGSAAPPIPNTSTSVDYDALSWLIADTIRKELSHPSGLEQTIKDFESVLNGLKAQYEGLDKRLSQVERSQITEDHVQTIVHEGLKGYATMSDVEKQIKSALLQFEESATRQVREIRESFQQKLTDSLNGYAQTTAVISTEMKSFVTSLKEAYHELGERVGKVEDNHATIRDEWQKERTWHISDNATIREEARTWALDLHKDYEKIIAELKIVRDSWSKFGQAVEALNAVARWAFNHPNTVKGLLFTGFSLLGIPIASEIITFIKTLTGG